MDALTIVANPRAAHQQSHASALADGVKRHGGTVTVQDKSQPLRTKVVACWGWRNGVDLRRAGHHVLVLERGYLGDRFAWTSLGWNGLNGRAVAPAAPADDGARFRQHFGHLLKPWRPDGRYVLLVGQVQGDMSLAGVDIRGWYAAQAKRAATDYGLPVRFRQHPMAAQRGAREAVPGALPIAGSLAEAIAGARVVVTFNSNTGVESVLAGKPTEVHDEGSMAYAVRGDAEPDREAWAARLAWRQWTIEEIRDGTAWAAVRGLAVH